MRLRATKLSGYGASARRQWTPAQLSTALWLDAADANTLTVSNLQVSQWNDKSGNGRNAVQATSASQPSYFTYQNLATYSETYTDAVWQKSRVDVLQNLVLRSQEFGDAVWSRSGITVGTNATTAPDGTTTAESLTETAGTAAHLTWQPASYAANRYTFSVYIKPNGRDFAFVRLVSSAAQWCGVMITMSTLAGTITNTGTVFTNASFTATDAGSGWVRVALTATASSTITDGGVGISDSATPTFGSFGDISYAGDNTKGIYVWGAQMVRGALPEAYTPTTSAAVVIPFSDPIGGTAAQKIVEGLDSTTTFSLRQNISNANGQYTASFYVKAGERTSCGIGMSDNATGDVTAIFDLTNGTLVTSSAGGSWSGLATAITAVGGGWYRISVTGTRGAGTLTTPYVIMVQSGSTTVYTGDGQSGVYVWGAQLNSATIQPYQRTLALASGGGVNSKTSLYFDGTNDGMSAAVPANTFPTVYEVYAVLQKQGASTTFEAVPLNRSLANAAQLLFDGYNVQRVYGNGTAFGQVLANQDVRNLTTASVFSYSLTSTTLIEYVNGTLSTSLSGSYFYGDTTQTTCWIATRGDGATRFRGVIGEIVAVSTALSTADRQKMEGYLAWKWGGA